MPFWRKDPIKRGYVSEIDKLLQERELNSASQKAEIAKYNRIDRLRDNPEFKEPRVQIWEEF